MVLQLCLVNICLLIAMQIKYAHVETFRAREFAYPVDGLIMEYENISYGKGLGVTGHHENR